MVAAILDGVEASAALRANVSERVQTFSAENGHAPGLVTVMAGATGQRPRTCALLVG